ncbi:MAG: hypothetical protein AAFU78_21245 [Cyanobacteria bacterium J06633_2]
MSDLVVGIDDAAIKVPWVRIPPSPFKHFNDFSLVRDSRSLISIYVLNGLL